MKVFVALSALLACASAGLAPAAVLRAPSHDSAIIQSHRFGGNFAYRTDEAHAYASINPVFSTVRRPVGVTYSHGAPIVKSTTVHAAPAVAYAAAPAVTYAAAPALTTYAAGHLGYAAGHLGYAGNLAYAGNLGYGYGLHGYGYGLPLSIEKVEEAVEAAE